jgi:hypothetical protein
MVATARLTAYVPQSVFECVTACVHSRGFVSLQYVWGSYKADAFTLDVKQFVASSGAVLPTWQPLHPASSITVEPRTLHAAASFAVNGVSGAVWFGGLVSKAGENLWRSVNACH